MIKEQAWILHDLEAFQKLLKKVSNGMLTNPNQENEMALVLRQSSKLRQSLLAYEKALGKPRKAE